MKILVDADACPVKDEIYRVARRHALPVVLVANSAMAIPATDTVRLEVVGGRFDAAKGSSEGRRLEGQPL